METNQEAKGFDRPFGWKLLLVNALATGVSIFVIYINLLLSGLKVTESNTDLLFGVGYWIIALVFIVLSLYTRRVILGLIPLVAPFLFWVFVELWFLMPV